MPWAPCGPAEPQLRHPLPYKGGRGNPHPLL